MAHKPPSRTEANKRETRRQYDKRRGSARERGYDNQWRVFSEQYRKDNPLCVPCLERGTVQVSEHVHHVEEVADRPDLKYDEGNLVAICKRCHDGITYGRYDRRGRDK